MKLDPKRLLRDAERAQISRPGSSIGREITGVTRAVRESMPVIRRLRAAGVTWAAIAQAMTEQGITQSGGRALTATRLTGVVSEVESRTRRSVQALGRQQRSDLVPGSNPTSSTRSEHGPAPPPRHRLRSPDEPHLATEEDIRRAGLAELQQLLRKK